jgi:hypothetical protein
MKLASSLLSFCTAFGMAAIVLWLLWEANAEHPPRPEPCAGEVSC